MADVFKYDIKYGSKEHYYIKRTNQKNTAIMLGAKTVTKTSFQKVTSKRK